MSIHDEFKDLESRLWLSKPQTEPLPPAFKRQLRQELMEQMTMNNNLFSFRTLGMALGGIILLIGIPLFFWLSQMSMGTADLPGATPDLSQGLDPARLVPTKTANSIPINGDEGWFTMPTEDKVWVISTNVPQGQTVSRYDTLDVAVGYDLVSAEEAKLVVKLFDSPRGVLTVEKTVYGTSGEVEFVLPLTELEEVMGESVDLELTILLQDFNPSAPKLYNLYMDQGWTVDLTTDPPTTHIEIVDISHPYQPEDYAEDEYRVDLTVTYRLENYDEALLVIGYEDDDGNDIGGRFFLERVKPGRNFETEYSFRLDQSVINESGEVEEWVNFFARINYYDETAAQWINIYPGNATLSDREQSLDPLKPHYRLFIEGTAWGEDELGQPLLRVNMGYDIAGESMADIMVNVTTFGETTEIAEDAISVNPGNGRVFVVLPFDQPLTADEPLLKVSADLTVGEIEIHHAKTVLIEGAPPPPSDEGNTDVWLVATEVMTQTIESGVKADINMVVGYTLSSDYRNGYVVFNNPYEGRMGWKQGVESGTSGILEFSFSFDAASWTAMQESLNTMPTNLKLFGRTRDTPDIRIMETNHVGTD